MIEIFEGRIEITNPGSPFVDTLRFIDHNPSRNEKLASFMRMPMQRTTYKLILGQ
jgi:predicted HTH transcriptional regulator